MLSVFLGLPVFWVPSNLEETVCPRLPVAPVAAVSLSEMLLLILIGPVPILLSPNLLKLASD